MSIRTFLALALVVTFYGAISSNPIIGQALAYNDPAGGFCNDVDPSSGLFAACIQAHSAVNRVEHLNAVGANEKAVAKAQLALDAATSEYAELSGGKNVPGLEASVPLIAVAYMNLDGNPGYSAAGADVLIAKITDDDGSGDLSVSDMITTAAHPTNFEGSSAPFSIPLTVPIYSITLDTDTSIVVVAMIDGTTEEAQFKFYSQASYYTRPDNCTEDVYSELSATGHSYLIDRDNHGGEVCFDSREGPDVDSIYIDSNSPSVPSCDPAGDCLVIRRLSEDDDTFIDVDFFTQ